MTRIKLTEYDIETYDIEGTDGIWITVTQKDSMHPEKLTGKAYARELKKQIMENKEIEDRLNDKLL